MRRLIISAALSAVCATHVSADNWPQWRGPSAVGVTSETGLPEKWTDRDAIAWRAKLPGLGVSTPVIWGDHVFVTSQIGSGRRNPGRHPSLVQGADAALAGERNLGGREPAAGEMIDASGVSFVVSAFRWSDGRVAWTHEVKSEGSLTPVHDKHNLATPSPVTDGSIVVAWFGTGQVVALDQASGKRLWTRHLAKEYGPFQINWGHASSPILHRDLAIFLSYHESGSYLLALDKKTGAVKWKRDRERTAHSYSTPLVIDEKDRSTLIVNSSYGVEGYNASTGEPQWHVAGDNRFPIPMAVHHNGVVYLSRGYRSSPYLAIKLGGSGDVSKSHVVWQTPTGAPYVSSLVYYDGLLYMASEMGIITAIDAATSEQVWRERVGGVFTASPVAGDGKIYFVSETGETVVVRAGRKPEVVARNKINAHLVASPAISRGRLFLRSDDELIAVGK